MNLLAPDLAAEIVLHFTRTGEVKTFASKVDDTPQNHAAVALGLFQAAEGYARAHGISISVTPNQQEKAP